MNDPRTHSHEKGHELTGVHQELMQAGLPGLAVLCVCACVYVCVCVCVCVCACVRASCYTLYSCVAT